jgi:L-threonylcarbamoyladenylate synthase
LYFDRYEPPSTPRFHRRVLMATPDVAAGTLYSALHDLDALGLSLIVVVPPPDRPEWRAVRDRLWRATIPL